MGVGLCRHAVPPRALKACATYGCSSCYIMRQASCAWVRPSPDEPNYMTVKGWPVREWQKLVSILLEALGDEVARRGRPAWLFVANDPDNQDSDAFSLGVGWDPEPVLGGIAPPEWMAVGVVATGKTFVPLPRKQKGYYVSGRRTGTVRMACLVTRDEGTFSMVVTSDGQVIEDPPGGGFLIDRLRYCIGLEPNPPNIGSDGAYAW